MVSCADLLRLLLTRMSTDVEPIGVHGLVRDHATGSKLQTGVPKWRKDGSIPSYINEEFTKYRRQTQRESRSRRRADPTRQAIFDEKERVYNRKRVEIGQAVCREALKGNDRGAQMFFLCVTVRLCHAVLNARRC